MRGENGSGGRRITPSRELIVKLSDRLKVGLSVDGECRNKAVECVRCKRVIEDLARRIILPDSIEDRPQLSTDGFACYRESVASSFGRRIDYGTIVKKYATDCETGRYAPPEVVASDRKGMWGITNLRSICTSHIERFNLSLRRFVKRFSRLSPGFSKKLTNLKAAVALHVFHSNNCRIHGRSRARLR